MEHRTFRAAQRIEGKSAAPGIALGPLMRLVAATSSARRARSEADEQQALADAIEASRLDLTELAGKVKDEDAEAILAFQIALLEDENLAAPAFAMIAGGEAANRAWLAAIDAEITTYDQADDSYFRARASDLRDLRDRVLRRLSG
jgi:phosphoenolpyruvate-protein phosphotransferase (PTS system enzyme I)